MGGKLGSAPGGLNLSTLVSQTGTNAANQVPYFSSSGIITSDSTFTTTNFPKWVKYSVTHTQFQIADVTKSITLFTLTAKQIIRDIVLKQTTSFGGGAIATYTLSLGKGGALTKYLAASDVLTAVGATVFYRPSTALTTGLESFTATTDVQVTAISTVANLSASTAGAADIYFLLDTLP